MPFATRRNLRSLGVGKLSRRIETKVTKAIHLRFGFLLLDKLLGGQIKLPLGTFRGFFIAATD